MCSNEITLLGNIHHRRLPDRTRCLVADEDDNTVQPSHDRKGDCVGRTIRPCPQQLDVTAQRAL